MLRALIRVFFRGIVALMLLAAAIGAYSLYRSGRLPYFQKAIADATVSGSVRAAYAIHRDLAHRDIRVDVEAGRVVLTGAVASAQERTEAGEIAASVEGVTRVDNRLEIDPSVRSSSAEARSLGERLDDVTLLAKVEAALKLDRETRGADLEVEVRSGRVVLRGRVSSEELRKRVLARISGVDGVAGLDDELAVTGGQ